MALRQGLNYVYLGNVWGREGENTYCPKCGEILIMREGLETKKIQLKKGKCPFCNHSIAGRFSN
jgi:pyruvate formate lyase activating enzyme